MDAAGKDGAIRDVMSGVNRKAVRCSASSIRARKNCSTISSGVQLRDLPERGRIGVFNRSYYEEVLIARVHPEIPRSEGNNMSYPKTSPKRRKELEAVRQELAT